MATSHEFDIPPSIDAVPGFMVTIEECRRDLSNSDWRDYCRGDKRLRDWRDYLCADPYTRHGLTKPRGYAGDAGLMDLAYGHPSIRHLIDAADDVGKRIYEYTSNAKQTISAIKRIDFVANQIRALSAYIGNPITMASFACGHARELERLVGEVNPLSKAYLIDNDDISLAEVTACYGAMFSLFPIRQSVFRIKAEDIESVDFAYSMGLFDYLKSDAAERILRTMAGTVRRGGRLLVGNLADTAANLGYCEGVMDWWMIPRSLDDMIQLGNTLSQEEDWRSEVFAVDCFLYLIAQRT